MKKIRPFFLVLGILAILMGIYLLLDNVSQKKKSVKVDLKHEVYDTRYVDLNDSQQKVIFTSYKQLEIFVENHDINEELLKEYDEKFFKNNNLATVYLVISNSALELEVKEVYKVDTKLTVKYDMEKKADMGATVVSAKIVAVKIDKNIREIILK